jgi:hypothetical protein
MGRELYFLSTMSVNESHEQIVALNFQRSPWSSTTMSHVTTTPTAPRQKPVARSPSNTFFVQWSGKKELDVRFYPLLESDFRREINGTPDLASVAIQ